MGFGLEGDLFGGDLSSLGEPGFFQGAVNISLQCVSRFEAGRSSRAGLRIIGDIRVRNSGDGKGGKISIVLYLLNHAYLHEGPA